MKMTRSEGAIGIEIGIETAVAGTETETVAAVEIVLNHLQVSGDEGMLPQIIVPSHWRD